MRGINNDQNIEPHTKMSEDFHDGNNSNLSKNLRSVNFLNNIKTVRGDNDGDLNVVDHLYATNVENGEIRGEINQESPPFSCQTADSEVKFIKEWLILHTDLIQQQNDDIIDKDREIYILRKENQMLKERILCIENGISQQNDRPSDQKAPEAVILEDMTQGHIQIFEEQYNSDNNTSCSLDILDFQENHVNLCDSESQIVENTTTFPTEIEDSVIEVKNEELIINDIINDINIDDTCFKTESDFLNCGSSVEQYNFTINNISDFDSMKNLRMSIRRKRVTSSSSGLSHNEAVNHEEKETSSRSKKKKRRPTKDDQILTSSEPYVTQAHEVNFGIPLPEPENPECTATITLEVPRWRHKIYASSYTLEGTENLDDEVFNKRHMRLENDERRRKRWDVQRIREQRVIEKLKQRQEKIGLGSKNEESESLQSLWPKVDDIKYLEITEELPVSAFGHSIPKINPREFELPWLVDPSVLTRKSLTRKSGVKRRSSKR
ncbi:unnamed protein product [Phaedon cochleariae]|uniref:PEHE domain-containing protein n=1 Tax=Phaedon cochleariae TaxID=80249 RepID=A0A9N9SKY1_PHACE|nr:unnamed protein product [Phaedon cochleariae]